MKISLFLHRLRRFFTEQRGFSTIEYLIGAGVVAGAAIAAFILVIGPATSELEEMAPDQYEVDYYEIT